MSAKNGHAWRPVGGVLFVSRPEVFQLLTWRSASENQECFDSLSVTERNVGAQATEGKTQHTDERKMVRNDHKIGGNKKARLMFFLESV